MSVTTLRSQAKFYALASLGVGLAAPAAHGAQAAYRNLVLSHGATAYYEFEQAAGATSAVDSAGGDNNGTYINVGLGQNSLNATLGKAASFTANGASSSRVQIPDGPTFDLGQGAMTTELWYFTNTAARGDLFTYKGGGGDYGIHSNSLTDPGFPATTNLYFNNYTASPNGVSLGQWHHVAVTRDATGFLLFYVDGIIRNSAQKTDTLNINNDILIGSNHNGTPGDTVLQFTGLIDEVAWYPVALSAEQVAQHYAVGTTVPEPSGAMGLVGAGVAALAARRRAH